MRTKKPTYSTLRVTTGTEGPRHDPYYYSEITITRPDGRRAVFHSGLGRHCRLIATDGVELLLDERDDVNIDRHFEMFIGVSPRNAERALRKQEFARLRSHRHCGGLEWHEGMPGEALLICVCGKVVDSHFNRRAIE